MAAYTIRTELQDNPTPVTVNLPASPWVSDRLFLYHFRAPSFRLFSGERVGNHERQRNEITRSEN